MSFIVTRDQIIPSDPDHLFRLIIQFKLQDYEQRGVSMDAKEFTNIAKMTPGRLKRILHEHIGYPTESDQYCIIYTTVYQHLPEFIDVRRPKAPVIQGNFHGK